MLVIFIHSMGRESLIETTRVRMYTSFILGEHYVIIRSDAVKCHKMQNVDICRERNRTYSSHSFRTFFQLLLRHSGFFNLADMALLYARFGLMIRIRVRQQFLQNNVQFNVLNVLNIPSLLNVLNILKIQKDLTFLITVQTAQIGLFCGHFSEKSPL